MTMPASGAACRVPGSILLRAGLAADCDLAVPSRDGLAERACAVALADLVPVELPDALVDALAGPAEMALTTTPDFAGLPVSRLLAASCDAGLGADIFARLGHPGFDGARVVSTAFHVAHVAGPRGGWPAALFWPMRRFLAAARGMVVPDLPLTRAMLLPWHARPDVQAAHDLADVQGRAAYMVWLLTQGLRDLGLGIEELEPRLSAWLSRPSRRLRRLPMVLELLWLARPDLREAFDISTEHGEMRLFDWAVAQFDADYAGSGLICVSPARYAVLTRAFGRGASVQWLTSFSQ